MAVSYSMSPPAQTPPRPKGKASVQIGPQRYLGFRKSKFTNPLSEMLLACILAQCLIENELEFVLGRSDWILDMTKITAFKPS